MNPVSRRPAGVTFDHAAAMPNERISAIRAPTLILHAKDDTLQLYRNAEFAAATIPGARLVSFAKGGHLVLAVGQPTLQRLMLRGFFSALMRAAQRQFAAGRGVHGAHRRPFSNYRTMGRSIAGASHAWLVSSPAVCTCCPWPQWQLSTRFPSR